MLHSAEDDAVRSRRDINMVITGFSADYLGAPLLVRASDPFRSIHPPHSRSRLSSFHKVKVGLVCHSLVAAKHKASQWDALANYLYTVLYPAFGHTPTSLSPSQTPST